MHPVDDVVALVRVIAPDIPPYNAVDAAAEMLGERVDQPSVAIGPEVLDGRRDGFVSMRAASAAACWTSYPSSGMTLWRNQTGRGSSARLTNLGTILSFQGSQTNRPLF